MPESTTILNRVKRTKQFIENSQTDKLWLAIGNTLTSWDNEELPPVVFPSVTAVEELLGLVPVTTISIVAEDPSGDIYTNFGRFKAYSTTASNTLLVSKLATFVYCAAFIDSFKVPASVTYRSLGLINNINFKAGTNISSGYVSSSQIISYDLLWLSHIKPQTVNHNSLEQIQLIVEF